MLPQLQQKLLEIIDNIISNPIADAFVYPYEGDPIYDSIIQNKMDLTTIKTKLESNKYSTHIEFFKDLELIWLNCQKFNQIGSIISKQSIYLNQQCKSIQKVVEAEFNLVKKKKKPPQQERPQQPPTQQAFDYRQKNKPSDEASRLNFCHQIKNLEQEQLIKIINYLAEFQPDALSKEGNQLGISVCILVINVKKLDSKACEQVNLM